MRIHFTRFLPIAILLSIVVVFVCLRSQVPAQRTPQKTWSQVQVVSYSSGLTGFFDTKTGRIDLSDGNLEQPFVIREIEELDKPLKKIKN